MSGHENLWILLAVPLFGHYLFLVLRVDRMDRRLRELEALKTIPLYDMNDLGEKE